MSKYSQEMMNVHDFKSLLTEFKKPLEEEFKENPQQAEEDDLDVLLDVIKRLQTELADVNTDEDFHRYKRKKCLPDIVYLLSALNELGDSDCEEEGCEECDCDEEFEED